MEPYLINSFIALIGLFGLKVAINWGVDLFGFWNLGKIFNPRRNQFLLHQYLREFGELSEPVRSTVAYILKDFGDCMEREQDVIYSRFIKHNRLEIDAFSVVPLDSEDPVVTQALEVVNRLLTKVFQMPKISFGSFQVERFVSFSINEFKKRDIKSYTFLNMLETEEYIRILQARCQGVETLSSIRVKIVLIEINQK